MSTQSRIPGWITVGKLCDSRNANAIHAGLAFLIACSFLANLFGVRIPISKRLLSCLLSGLLYVLAKTVYGSSCPQLLQDTDGELEAFKHYKELTKLVLESGETNHLKTREEIKLKYKDQLSEVETLLLREKSLNRKSVDRIVDNFISILADSDTTSNRLRMLEEVQDPALLNYNRTPSRFACVAMLSMSWLFAGVHITITAVFVFNQLDLPV